MNPTLEKELIDKYPEIFMFNNISSFDFEHNDGWYFIIDAFFYGLVSEARRARNHYLFSIEKATYKDIINAIKLPDADCIQNDKLDYWNQCLNEIPKPFQIKEKFGELRIYMDNTNKIFDSLESMALALSKNTCEYCGLMNHSVMLYPIDWHKTLCDSCSDKAYGGKAIKFRANKTNG